MLKYCCDKPGYVFLEDCGRTFELWVGKVFECSKLGELSCGSVEGNTEYSVDDTSRNSEESLKTPRGGGRWEGVCYVELRP